MSLNFIWRSDKWYNKRVLTWRFTLVLIKINWRSNRALLYNKPSILYQWKYICPSYWHVCGFFHLYRRTTVIQDLLVRRQFSLVPDNRTNVNVEAWMIVVTDNWTTCRCNTTKHGYQSKRTYGKVVCKQKMDSYIVG